MKHGTNSGGGGEQHAAASTTGGTRKKLGHAGQRGPQRGEGVSAHALPQGACENLVCALKLLVNRQTGGDSLVDMLYSRVCRSRPD